MNEEKKVPILPDVALETHKKKQLIYLIVIPVVILLIGGAFVLGMLLASSTPDVVIDTETDDSIIKDTLDDSDTTTQEDVDLDVSVGEHAIVIDWLSLENQKKIDVTPELVNALYTEDWQQSFKEGATAFQLGTVTGGEYNGFILAFEVYEFDGLGTNYMNYYTLRDSDGLIPTVILDRYATNNGSFVRAAQYVSARDVINTNALQRLGSSVIFDAGAIIAAFEQAPTVKDTRGNTYIFYGIAGRWDFPSEIEYSKYPLSATLENGRRLRLIDENITSMAYGGEEMFFILREDGRLALYELHIPFWPATTASTAEPNIIWPSGSYNRQNYLKGELGGCGISSVINVVDIADVGALKEGGYFTLNSVRKPVYEPVSLNSDYFVTGFTNWNNLQEDALTLDDFALIHPYFYYQDVFGRWIEFAHESVLPAAECGKPVVYLYPEETMDVNVSLEPQGGFSYTEPVYNDGWRVTAHPDGMLVNKDDGKIYPYLFWEGRGSMYAEPEYYWVVKKSDVSHFLVTTLQELGLNKQETVDFMAFWYPRMKDAPWYKIGFHGTDVMDQIAPIKLSQEPDSVLRILMDYTELEEQIRENPPTIPVFERNGFSVVEWGGVLR